MAIVHTREELHDLLKTEREARLAAEKQAEAHLRELEALRKAKEAPAITYVQNWLLNNLKYAAVVTDSAGNIMSINDEFVKLFLLPAPQEAYIGTPLEELEKQTLLSHLIPHREALANGNLYDDATLPDGTVVERETCHCQTGRTTAARPGFTAMLLQGASASARWSCSLSCRRNILTRCFG